jgi:hypothetical protein
MANGKTPKTDKMKNGHKQALKLADEVASARQQAEDAVWGIEEREQTRQSKLRERVGR